MILEMLTWGFFTAWGWFGANYIKEEIWPPSTPAIEQKAIKKESNEQSQTTGK